ncbi:glycoside hydrolase family 2 protein [Novipirellula artificiosorum]|uniref:Beta-galactosidase n=1 Tax=Novipirellula artificiosorum TaxID=2528016 RepID=A0A5C6D7J7_9BACT|nr:sugar-binding domain-containing protein [Novipirellula artificiosorum]TWU30859.1 Beta-galactosidase [Novipirellula artificiosorum]
MQRHLIALSEILLVVLGWHAFPALAQDSSPQPQSSPHESVSLDGAWEILFDPDNQGRRQQWHQQAVFMAQEDRREIVVPSCWEEIEKDYEGVGFYARHFTVPKAWEGKTVRVQFDAVNYIAEVYVNDHVVGRHEGGYGPCEFRIDDLLKYDEQNFVSLRVIGPIVAQNKVIDGIGWSDMPHWRGAIAGGIWQSVRLVATGTAFVDDLFLEPRLADDTVTVHATIENAEQVGRETQITVSIRSEEQLQKVIAEQTTTLKLVPGKNEKSWTISIPNTRYWSPDDPHLYVATIRIAACDGVVDVEEARFGMRELTIRNNKFELNGKPIYIKAAFFEGLYPTKLALPDSPEMARREIQLAKECGFNMIRPWRKPPPPMWLDLCDEMGVMVVGGLPIECMRRWPTVTPQLRDRIENEVQSALLRDRNRACIVQWEIFNEIGRQDLERLKHSTSMLARRLDPTRLILDESGGFAGGANIYLPKQFEPEVFNDVHNYPGAPLNDVSYDKFLTLSKTAEEIEAMGLPAGRFSSKTTPGRLTVVSEIGYGSLPDLVDNNQRFAKDGNPLVPPYRYHKELAQSFRDVLSESGLDSIYPNLQQFCLDQQVIHSQGNKRMLEAIRSNSSTGGYAVHALTGGDWVLGAGLIDLFRNPKGSFWGTKEANQPQYLALRVRPRNIYASQGATISVTGINDLAGVAGRLKVDVISEEGTLVFQEEQDVELVAGIAPIFEMQLHTEAMSGSYTAVVKLLDDEGAVVAQNSVSIDVFASKQPVSRNVGVAVFDNNNLLRPFLKESGISFIEFDAKTPKSLPVFVSRAFAGSEKVKKRFAELHQFVSDGGTAVYLETVQRGPQNSFWGGSAPAKEVLPIDLNIQHAMGLWVGVSHIVTDHPVFAGLPTQCMMGQVYENVWSPQTLRATGGQLIVGSVSHGWFQGNSDAQNYLGPSPAWYGMDMGVVSRGRGRYVLSSLRLLENLGTDPVADKILFNLIDWTTGGEPVDRTPTSPRSPSQTPSPTKP